MMNFNRIGWQEFQSMLSEYGADGVYIVDVRDEQSYEAGHIENAIHLSGSNVGELRAKRRSNQTCARVLLSREFEPKCRCLLSRAGFRSGI